MAKRESIQAKKEPATRVLTMTRIFDAPRALVYRAFADPKEALKWSGPREYPAVRIEGDLRPGGAWRACLRGVADGRELWQGGVYHEVVPNERLVFTFAWEGEARELGPETLITITFADQGDKTLMTFRQGVFDTKDNRDGHRVGWTSAFDRLTDLLARNQRARK